MRVGLFGGTFDPPHIGHLVVAQDALEGLELDHVRFVVAGEPPHKGGRELSPSSLRLAMVRAAVGPDPRFRVSRREVDRLGPSWTVETLRELHEAEPGVRWHLLVGADQLERFHTWRCPNEVARLARLTVLAREGRDPRDMDPEADVVYETVPVTRVDVSSTDVRERVRSGRPIRYRVPDAVREIIRDEGLYRLASAGGPRVP
jgi:nicotinate-nucleotide adenylyltransferase